MNNLFHYCPSCGKKSISFVDAKHWVCTNCGFDLFFNVACSAAVILEVDGAVLFVRRGLEPKKGMLSLPGGFIDAGESAEEACVRECKEETGVTPCNVTYLASFPNIYEYNNVRYNTCDFFFTANCTPTVLANLVPVDSEEIISFERIKLSSVEDVENLPIAFESVTKALKQWILSTGK